LKEMYSHSTMTTYTERFAKGDSLVKEPAINFPWNCCCHRTRRY